VTASFGDDVLASALSWLQTGHRVAIGTVLKTWGSAPRPTGSQIAVRDDGAFAGSVSGGCVESAVIEEAQTAMRDGRHRMLEFGVSDEQAWSVGLACGGRIEILVEPVSG
jgi:xanthine dehydrogenase accessory factor